MDAVIAWIAANPWILLSLGFLPQVQNLFPKLAAWLSKLKPPVAPVSPLAPVAPATPGILMQILQAWLKSKGLPIPSTLVDVPTEVITELHDALGDLRADKADNLKAQVAALVPVPVAK